MQRSAILALAVLGTAILFSGHATAADDIRDIRKVQLQFLAFNEDSSEYLVKVLDENIGSVLQVRETRNNELVKAYPFSADEEDRTVKRIRARHKLTVDPHEDPANPRKEELTMLLGQKGDKLMIYIMKGEQIKTYDSIPLLTNKDGEVAKATMKQLVWDQDGKNVVIIYHQKFPGQHGFASDFVHSFKFRSFKVSFE